MKITRQVALIVMVAAVSGCASNGASTPVQRAAVPFPSTNHDVGTRPAASINFANEAPLKFAAGINPAQKVFSVLGLPSLDLIPAKKLNNSYFQDASREQVAQSLAGTVKPKVNGNGALTTIAATAIGGGLGNAALAFSMLDGKGFDPRVENGYAVCFEPKSNTPSVKVAAQRCGTKIHDMVASSFAKVFKVSNLPNSQRVIGEVQVNGQLKVGELYIGKVGGTVGEGYAPEDKGGFAAYIVAIPFRQEVKGTGWVSADGELGAEQMATALAPSKPSDMVFFLPNKNNPIGVY